MLKRNLVIFSKSSSTVSSSSSEQFWHWTNSMHETAPVFSNKYNALAIKHQTTTRMMKHKMINDGDTDALATKIAGKGDDGTKIVLEKKAKMPQKSWGKAMMYGYNILLKFMKMEKL
uniref:Uncharacterized protein n=1 Tax=Romanomermis culicivorax TaxID=13658 RepID=A0A915L701_ROMCU